MNQPEPHSLSSPLKATITLALAAASPVMAAEISDEATVAPSRANGIDNDPTVIR